MAIIVWRICQPRGSEGRLFLGLIAAIAIAAGALMALREDGYEVLVKVPGGTSAAAASAPPATPAPPPAAKQGQGRRIGGSTTRGDRRRRSRQPLDREERKSGPSQAGEGRWSTVGAKRSWSAAPSGSEVTLGQPARPSPRRQQLKKKG